MPETTTPDRVAPSWSPRHKLLADFAVLDLYDELRHARGYDYGGGQRRQELNRRRRLLRDRGYAELVDAPDLFELLEADELLAAFERVALPRMRRQGSSRPEAWYVILHRIARRGAELLPDRKVLEEQNGYELGVDTIVEVYCDRRGVR